MANVATISGNTIADSGIDLTEALLGKANAAHSHAITDVSGLQTALEGKQKTITSGTAAPSGGADGDIYLQYT